VGHFFPAVPTGNGPDVTVQSVVMLTAADHARADLRELGFGGSQIDACCP
jgi:hypothetical protein